jgi:transposase
MPAVKYVVKLKPEQRKELLVTIRRGKSSARKMSRARILLKADERFTDEQIAEIVHVGSSTVGRVRQRFVEKGLDNALNELPRPGGRRKFTGKQEAHLIATACSKAPEGHARWTLRLLADKAVELGFSESCSYEAVRKVLKKTTSSRGKRSNGAYRL